MARPSAFRAIASQLFAVVLPCSSGPNVLAYEQTYTPRSQEEVAVLSLVVASEMKANNWAKSDCGFELQLEYTQLDLSQSVKVRSKVIDLREINKGGWDLATLLRDGEYSLRKVDGKWSINEYVTTPDIAAFFMKVVRTTTHFSANGVGRLTHSNSGAVVHYFRARPIR